MHLMLAIVILSRVATKNYIEFMHMTSRVHVTCTVHHFEWQKCRSKMGKSCCAVGCANRYAKGSGIHFYRFPENPERRAQWIAAVDRKNWEPNHYTWICSAHFVSGVKSNDPLSPDYVPSVFGHTKSPVKRKLLKDVERYVRAAQAKKKILL